MTEKILVFGIRVCLPRIGVLYVQLYRFSCCFHKVKMGFFILTESTLIGRVLYPGFC